MRRLSIALIVAVSVSGCQRLSGARCEDPELYSGSEQIPPVQVPDDLTPPNESESLRIPPAPQDGEDASDARGPCLESPPEYFEEGAPG